MSRGGRARSSTSTGTVRTRMRYATNTITSATMIATAESAHHHPRRISKTLTRIPTVTKTSARVCAASATSSSLPSSVPRRCSYQVIKTFAPSVSASHPSCQLLTSTRCVPLTRWLTAPRTSSKQVIDRNPTMASAPSVSNLPCP